MINIQAPSSDQITELMQIFQWDCDSFVAHMQTLIALGSTQKLLTLQDIIVNTFTDQLKDDTILINDMVVLLKQGTSYLSAMAFTKLTQDQRQNVSFQHINSSKDDYEQSYQFKPSDIVRSLFIWFFYLYTQARCPAFDDEDEQQRLPAFLKSYTTNVLDLNRMGQVLGYNIARNTPPEWIKKIKINQFSVEAKNRLRLSCAGYRFIQAIVSLPVRDNASNQAKICRNAVEKLYAAGLIWDIHPLTRSQKVSQLCASLNDNLQNIMFQIYDDQQIKLLKDQKMIFSGCQEKVSIPSQVYKSWSVNVFDQILIEKESIQL